MATPELPHTIRPATPDDAGEMARIYNQGIAERAATFETRTKTGRARPADRRRRARARRGAG